MGNYDSMWSPLAKSIRQAKNKNKLPTGRLHTLTHPHTLACSIVVDIDRCEFDIWHYERGHGNGFPITAEPWCIEYWIPERKHRAHPSVRVNFHRRKFDWMNTNISVKAGGRAHRRQGKTIKSYHYCILRRRTLNVFIFPRRCVHDAVEKAIKS